MFNELYRRGNADEIEERLKNTIIEEDVESSPEKDYGGKLRS
jgi:hypothetical protein